jgi:hypothetical protein
MGHLASDALETQARAPAVGVHLDPLTAFQHLNNRAGLKAKGHTGLFCFTSPRQ